MTPRSRRVLALPAVALLEAFIIVSAPMTLLISGVVSALTRSSRALRATALVIAYAAIELSTLARIRIGVEDWDQLIRRVLGTAHHAMCRILDISVSLEDGSAEVANVQQSRGVIVLARHCGPGDTLFVAWLLAEHYGLRLRIVLKDALLWEPTLNLAGDHLPFCFVEHGGTTALDSVRTLAREMQIGDCLLLFPEGGNFTWPRWRAAVRALAAAGDHARHRTAQAQTHTLPPRPGGAVAALEAATTADVLLLAHSGLSSDGRDRPWWRVPIHQPLAIRTVLLPAASVPRNDAAARAFLDDAWTHIDTWVEGHADLAEFTKPNAR